MQYLQYKREEVVTAYYDWPNWDTATPDENKTLYYNLTSSNIVIDDSGNGYEPFTINWQIIDYAGNTVNVDQTIIIRDMSDPGFVTPSTTVNTSPIEATIGSGNNTSINLPRLVVTDNVDVQYLRYKRVELTGGFTNWPNWPPAADSYGEDTVPLNYVLTGSNIIIPDTGGSGYEEFSIKWEIEDYANNITEHIQTIKITDNIGPDISGIDTSVSGVNQNAAESADITVNTPTTVSDNVSLDSDIELQYQVLDQDNNIGVDWTDATADSTVTVTVDYPSGYSAAGDTIQYTVKWRATDQANNTTTSTTTTTVLSLIHISEPTRPY